MAGAQNRRANSRASMPMSAGAMTATKCICRRRGFELLRCGRGDPIELLQHDWHTIYTWPQTTLNRMSLRRSTANSRSTENWTLQGNVYVRAFQQAHLDGNGADVERCSNASPAVPQSALPGRRRLPAAEPGHDRIPQPVRGSRPEQQSDSLPAGRRQHLRARRPTARSTAPLPTR